MRAIEWLAEQRILEAMERGDFDNLPGAGKPLALDRDPAVPDEMWLAFKILKNAGVLPPEVEAHKEIRRLDDLLRGLEDGPEKVRALTRLSLLQTRFESGRAAPSAVSPRYREEISARLAHRRAG
jgi:hypothetical protein